MSLDLQQLRHVKALVMQLTPALDEAIASVECGGVADMTPDTLHLAELLEEGRLRISAPSSATERVILKTLYVSEPLTSTELAKRIGLAVATIKWHLHCSRFVRKSNNQKHGYYLTQQGRRIVEKTLSNGTH